MYYLLLSTNVRYWPTPACHASVNQVCRIAALWLQSGLNHQPFNNEAPFTNKEFAHETFITPQSQSRTLE